MPTTLDIQAAIDGLPDGGGTISLPPGVYDLTEPIRLRPGIRLVGAGQGATVLRFHGIDDGLKMVSPLNKSTPVTIGVTDLTVANTVGATNTGGGIVDIGGTFWRVERVTVIGFAYGVIFDQTEIADILGCQFTQQHTAGVWLVNGEDHLGAGSGVQGGFTNRIGVQNCQLDPNPPGTRIIDDGGYTHCFTANNFNGGQQFLRLAGVDVCLVTGNEMEGCASDGIVATYTTSVLGTRAGQCGNLTLSSNLVAVAHRDRNCVRLVDGSPVLGTGNLYATGVAAIAVQDVYSLTSIADFADGPGPLIDGKAANQLVLGSVCGSGRTERVWRK